MHARRRIRDILAAVFRSAPRFRGKARIGMALGQRFLLGAEPPECFAVFKMRNGVEIEADLRLWLNRAPFWTGEYEPAVLDRLCECLKPEDVVLDVGANVGYYSLAFGERLRRLGAGKVFAFEPVEGNFRALCGHIERNGLSDFVKAANVALGSREGEISMFTGKLGHGEQVNAVMLAGNVQEYVTATFGADAQRTERARLSTLDRMAGELHIERCDLIKVDIEGAELEFLRGGADFIYKNRPIILGEFNPVWLEQFGETMNDVVQLAARWDYRMYRHQGRGRFAPLRESDARDGEALMIPRNARADRLEALGIEF